MVFVCVKRFRLLRECFVAKVYRVIWVTKETDYIIAHLQE